MLPKQRFFLASVYTFVIVYLPLYFSTLEPFLGYTETFSMSIHFGGGIYCFIYFFFMRLAYLYCTFHSISAAPARFALTRSIFPTTTVSNVAGDIERRCGEKFTSGALGAFYRRWTFFYRWISHTFVIHLGGVLAAGGGVAHISLFILSYNIFFFYNGLRFR